MDFKIQSCHIFQTRPVLKPFGFDILTQLINYFFAVNLGSVSITVPHLSQVLNSSEL